MTSISRRKPRITAWTNKKRAMTGNKDRENTVFPVLILSGHIGLTDRKEKERGKEGRSEYEA